MKLIIDIDEDYYNELLRAYKMPFPNRLVEIIANGIPLKEKENNNESECMD